MSESSVAPQPPSGPISLAGLGFNIGLLMISLAHDSAATYGGDVSLAALQFHYDVKAIHTPVYLRAILMFLLLTGLNNYARSLANVFRKRDTPTMRKRLDLFGSILFFANVAFQFQVVGPLERSVATVAKAPRETVELLLWYHQLSLLILVLLGTQQILSWRAGAQKSATKEKTS